MTASAPAVERYPFFGYGLVESTSAASQLGLSVASIARRIALPLSFALCTLTSAAGVIDDAPPPALARDVTSDGSFTVAWVGSGASSIGTATSVRELRERSGLTWDEFAGLFGVSRRAVHSWAAGGRMNSVNAARLQDLATLVAQFTGSPGTVRAALLAPDQVGRSIYRRFGDAGRHTPARKAYLPSRLGSDVEPVPQPLGRIVDFQVFDE